jgi:transcriptional regulator with XRE-family HTH domain
VIEKQLGQRIAALRKAKDYTQQTLAEKTGYSVEFISLVERGINAPSVAGCAVVAKALGVSVAELFTFKEGRK